MPATPPLKWRYLATAKWPQCWNTSILVVTSSSGTSMPPIVPRIDSLRPVSSPFGFSPSSRLSPSLNREKHVFLSSIKIWEIIFEANSKKKRREENRIIYSSTNIFLFDKNNLKKNFSHLRKTIRLEIRRRGGSFMDDRSKWDAKGTTGVFSSVRVWNIVTREPRHLHAEERRSNLIRGNSIVERKGRGRNRHTGCEYPSPQTFCPGTGSYIFLLGIEIVLFFRKIENFFKLWARNIKIREEKRKFHYISSLQTIILPMSSLHFVPGSYIFLLGIEIVFRKIGNFFQIPPFQTLSTEYKNPWREKKISLHLFLADYSFYVFPPFCPGTSSYIFLLGIEIVPLFERFQIFSIEMSPFQTLSTEYKNREKRKFRYICFLQTILSIHFVFPPFCLGTNSYIFLLGIEIVPFFERLQIPPFQTLSTEYKNREKRKFRYIYSFHETTILPKAKERA